MIKQTLTEQTNWLIPLQKTLQPLHWYFAEFIKQQYKQQNSWLYLVAALSSYWLGKGHVCLPTQKIKILYQQLLELNTELSQSQKKSLLKSFPSETQAFELLSASFIIGDGSHLTPLVLQNNKIYLQRYWHYEANLASQLLNRTLSLPVNFEQIKVLLTKYFPEKSSEINWQKVACAITLEKNFSLINGGPGTGKTTTVVRILAALIELQGQQVRIGLAAPTGKAAARLKESIIKACTSLPCSEFIQSRIPKSVSTIHRLLGANSQNSGFYYNKNNLLHLQALIVDEASMVDLELMHAIIQALPKDCRLVLLGDRNQLASVQAGSVLADICASTQVYSVETVKFLTQVTSYPSSVFQQSHKSSRLGDCLVSLRKSWRFDEQSSIGALSRAVNSADLEQVKKVIEKKQSDVIFFDRVLQGQQQFIEQLLEGFSDYLQEIKVTKECSVIRVQSLLALFSQYRILAATHSGSSGVEYLNRILEVRIKQLLKVDVSSFWYSGRPVLITHNHYELGLANGDIGICLKDDKGRLLVWFEGEHGPTAFFPNRLPEHKCNYVMTVHRSQGSEFSKVALVLPDNSPILTKELLYTGVTRAKKQLNLYATHAALKNALAQTVERDSGLSQRLYC